MLIDGFSFGSGPRNLVIIPGMSVRPVILSRELIISSYSCFSKDFTVHLLDRRPDYGAGTTVEDMAEDIMAAMKESGVENADFIGCSQGGMIAMTIAVNHPEMVNSLVLASTAPSINPTAAAVMDKWDALSLSGDIRALNHEVYKLIFSDPFYEKFREALSRMEGLGTEEDLKRFHILACACKDFDISARLGEIKCPAFVIGASEDRVLTPQASVEIAEGIPGAELYIYQGYGHAVYDETPDYKSRVLEFLLRF